MVDLTLLSEDLLTLRTCVISSLSFLLCLRVSEVANLHSDDISRVGDELFINVRHSKNKKDGFMCKATIDSSNKYCTASLLLLFLQKASICLDGPSRPIFTRFSRCAGSSYNISKSVQVSISTLAAQFKILLRKIGLDPRQYGTHSCRRGFASAAAEAGASELELQTLGRWKVGSKMPGLYVSLTQARADYLTSQVSS